MWWAELAKVKVYVREYYSYTPWSSCINASATGTPCQEVIRTSRGTITWIPNDTRINIYSLETSLRMQMTTGPEAWNPETGMAKHYHRGRTPVQIANVLHARRNTQGFQ